MSKNCLKWITIASEQAMLMSVCLQSMVDELLNQKGGTDTNNIQVQHSQRPFCQDLFNTFNFFFLEADKFQYQHNYFLYQT